MPEEVKDQDQQEVNDNNYRGCAARANRRQLPDRTVMPEEVKDQDQQEVNDNYRGCAARANRRQLPDRTVMPEEVKDQGSERTSNVATTGKNSCR